MYQLVESIKIENRQAHLIDLHNKRFNASRKIMFGNTDEVDLADYIKIPKSISNDRHKCRVCFDGNTISVDISPYTQRSIQSLKVVFDNEIDYTIKTTNRTLLDKAFSKRENCDDVIIIKNGFVADSWAANILFFDGKQWITPTTPLLKGVQRENLLQKGIVVEKEVTTNDICYFKAIKLINALVSFEASSTILIPKGIHF